MTNLSGEMLLFLLIAFLLGLLIGWSLGRYRRREQTGRLEEKWRLKHEHSRRRLEDCRKELEACRQQLGGRIEVAEGPEENGPDDTRAGSGESGEVDDLKKIEGIGPKIEGLLNTSGIETWSKLAAVEVELLRSILDEAGPRYRLHDPSTWPQQAELAASGAWDELEELQGRLKGGRKT